MGGRHLAWNVRRWCVIEIKSIRKDASMKLVVMIIAVAAVVFALMTIRRKSNGSTG